MFAAYEGDWRKAGEAALGASAELFGAAERWCAVPALRDYALRSGDHARVIALISARYNLPLQRPWEHPSLRLLPRDIGTALPRQTLERQSRSGESGRRTADGYRGSGPCRFRKACVARGRYIAVD